MTTSTDSTTKPSSEAAGTPSAAANISANGKTKVEKWQSLLGIVSTAIGIIGAVGTGFVWIAANLCVGDVEIKPTPVIEQVVVKVIDKKGQQATYFTKHVSLMPGDYHLEVGVPDQKATKHVDVSVQMWKSSVVPYAVPAEFVPAAEPGAENASAVETEDAKSGKKRWWQIWRKKDSSK